MVGCWDNLFLAYHIIEHWDRFGGYRESSAYFGILTPEVLWNIGNYISQTGCWDLIPLSTFSWG